MASVKVKFFGMLKEIVGSREETVKVDDSVNAIEIVRALSSKHGKRFGDFVFERNGRLRDGFAYAVNGESVSESALSSIKCNEIQEFVILPPISGG